MSNSLEATGIIRTIGLTTEYGDNGFTKREFVIKLTGEHESDEYPNYVELELIKDKCSIMDAYQSGMEIKAFFNLQGRLWQGEGKPEKCFNALQAWKIENLGGQQAPAPQQAPQQQAPQFAPQQAPQQQAPQAPKTDQQILVEFQQIHADDQNSRNAMWSKLTQKQQETLQASLT